MGAQFGWPAYVLSSTVAAFTQLQQDLLGQGIPIGIAEYGGFRSLADTTDILAFRETDYTNAIASGELSPSVSIDEFRPIAPYQHSFHDYGAAFDIRFKSLPAGMTSDDAEQLAGQLAPELGLRWGGSFQNPDGVHFELDITLSQARTMWQSEFGASAPAGIGGTATAMIDASGLGPDDVGDDSGEAALELELQQQNQLVGWILVGAAIASTLALFLSGRLGHGGR